MRAAFVGTAVLLALALAACGGRAHRTQRVLPSGFVVHPNITDRECNLGKGARLPARLGGISVVAATAMPDGSTLISLSGYGYFGNQNLVVLRSVTKTCSPNLAFGLKGTARLRLAASAYVHQPSGLDPGFAGFWINTITPAAGGGAILAGVQGPHWLLGEVTPDGRLNHSFGANGWVVLPYHGEITAVLPEPSGRIVVAGDNGGGGCCTRNWAAAVSSNGRPERTFGHGGRIQLPTGEDSGVASLALEPNGNILAEINYGNMGCWGTALAMLTRDGQRVPGFAEKLARFWKEMGFGAFVGDTTVDSAGFTLIGAGQRNDCAFAGGQIAPRARGLIARFRPNGELIGKVVHYRSALFGTVDALQSTADIFVVEIPYFAAERITIRAYRENGSLDRRFGANGQVLAHTPWWGKDAQYGADLVVIRRSDGFELLSTMDTRSEIRLTRLTFAR